MNLTISPADPTHFIPFNVFTGQAGLDDFSFSFTDLIYYNFNNSYDPIILFDGIGVGGNTPDGNIAKLPLDTAIDSSLNFNNPNYLAATWSDGGEGLVGFQTAGGNFGWARLDIEVVPDPTYPDSLSVTLLDFAVESDSGVPIAGPVVVPEPATMTLVLIGCATMLGFPRRTVSRR